MGLVNNFLNVRVTLAMLTEDKKLIKRCRSLLWEIFTKELDKFIDLFFYEKAIDISGHYSGVLEKAGLIRREGDLWIANVMVFPFRGKLIVTDFLLSLYKKKGQKYVRGLDDVWVMFPHETLLFIEKLGHIKGKLALDLASGSGGISLFLADKFDAVISSDINPKAVRFARFNAVLNNLEDKITNLQADLFAGIKAEKFDYICWNGPTVAMPEVSEPEKIYPLYTYGGKDGAEFTKRFLDEVFSRTKKKFKIKWWDGSLGNWKQSAVEDYIRNNFSHLPIKVTIEFLNKRRGIPLKEYDLLYKKYCLNKFDLNQSVKQRDVAVKSWYKDLKHQKLTFVYITLISIEPGSDFEVIYKYIGKSLVSARHVFGFEWHFASRNFIRSYLTAKNFKLALVDSC